MFQKSVISVAIVAMFSVSNVYAWGLTDLVGVGMQAGGKLVWAGVEKATEAKPDPEAEAARKREDERGKTQPHKSTVLLLKLLDKHPELLDEVR